MTTVVKTYFELAELAKILGVESLPMCAQVDGRTPLRGISTDSRRIAAGELFVALVGERYDGHDYLGAAAAAGAAAMVVERGRIDILELVQKYPGSMFLPVADTLEALGRLAAARLKKIGARVLAVTGSNGKSTTKEMTAAILKKYFRVHQTPGNFNNRIGLPLTLFAMPDDTEIAVLEMGMNEPGEIGRLAAIARPEVAILTNIAEAHLAGLGSAVEVAANKLEIIDFLKPEGKVVYNADDPWLAEMLPGRTLKRAADNIEAVAVSWHGASTSPVKAGEIWLKPEGLSFVLENAACKAGFSLPLWGRHNVKNAALAITAAMLAGRLELDDCVAPLAGFQNLAGRLQHFSLGQEGGMLVHDAYNANPASMEAALTAVAERRAGRFLALVLGDMNELGAGSGRLHAELGRRVAEMRPDLLVLLGREVLRLAEAAIAAGLPADRVYSFAAGAHEAALDCLFAGLPAAPLLLLKGSRSLALENLITPLCRHFEAA